MHEALQCLCQKFSILQVEIRFVSGLFESSRVQYASDASMKIVFSCCQPSIVVSYDTVQGIHSVWALRKVTQDVSDHTDTPAKSHSESTCV